MTTVCSEVAQELLNFFSRFLSFVSSDTLHVMDAIIPVRLYGRQLKALNPFLFS
jgi:hypothetical protein